MQGRYSQPGHGRRTLSGALLHSLHITSPVLSVCVFLQVYSLVGSNCSQSSNIPATVYVGHGFQPLSHQKHSSRLRLMSSLLMQVSFPYQLCSGTAFHVFCSKPLLSSTFSFSAVITSSLLLLLLLLLLVVVVVVVLFIIIFIIICYYLLFFIIILFYFILFFFGGGGRYFSSFRGH